MAPTALDELLGRHRTLRAESRAVAAALAGGVAVSTARLRRLERVVRSTQAAEEAVVFPALAQVAAGFDPSALVADHVEVAAAADGVRAAVRAGSPSIAAAEAARLARLLGAHLDDEERIVVPLWPLLSPEADRAVLLAGRAAVGLVGRAALAHLQRRGA